MSSFLDVFEQELEKMVRFSHKVFRSTLVKKLFEVAKHNNYDPALFLGLEEYLDEVRFRDYSNIFDDFEDYDFFVCGYKDGKLAWDSDVWAIDDPELDEKLGSLWDDFYDSLVNTYKELETPVTAMLTLFSSNEQLRNSFRLHDLAEWFIEYKNE